MTRLDPSIDKPVTITHIIATGSGFAETEEGESVFVSGNIMYRSRAMLGDILQARLIRNDRDAERTPWRCVYLAPAERGEQIPRTQAVLSVLEAGGVWTPDEMAEETDIPEPACRAIMEAMFRSGLGAKYLRYTDPFRNVDLVAFSHHPEAVRLVSEGEPA